MNTKIRPYGKLWDLTTLKSPDISLPDLAVYGYLCYRAGSSGSCYPTQNRISADLHLSCDSLTRITRHLTRAGAISLTKIRAPGRQGYSHRYKISPPPSSQTYGIITERMITICRDLSCGAIGLWVYLTAAAGTGSDVYISRSDLADRLNISLKTLRKYTRELIASGELSTYQEQYQGSNITRFIVAPSGNFAAGKIAVITLSSPKLIDPSSPTALPDKALPMDRQTYLSLDSCQSPQEALARQTAIKSELDAIYSDQAGTVSYDTVTPHLTRYVRGSSRSSYMAVIKTDLAYLIAHEHRLSREWLADPLIRSCALDAIFGDSSHTAAQDLIVKQLFWMLGSDSDARDLLIDQLDEIVTGRQKAKQWLNILAVRVKAALDTRPIRCPAAYVRRLIINWLTEKHAQTTDTITYLESVDETPADVPQTYAELVEHSVCARFRKRIKRLPKKEYRALEAEYNGIVQSRAMAGDPLTMDDIYDNPDIEDLYCLMPQSYYGVLDMLELATATAILRLPERELSRRAAAYGALPVSGRRDVLWDSDLTWMIEPDIAAENISAEYKAI